MSNLRSAIMGVVTLLACAPAFGAELDQLIKGQPSDVRAYVDRRAGCNHWLGEEPYNAERRAEINKALAQLRCNAAERDKLRLQQRYKANAKIQQILRDADAALW